MYQPDFSPTQEAVDALLEHIIQQGKTRTKQYTLERMQAAMAELDNPQNATRTVHIAGTSGKGSTAALMESILRAHGKEVGVFASPALSHSLDRIRINGRIITPRQYMRILKRIWPVITTHKLTYFETFTAIAFMWFAERKLDVAVIETGMGGRLDATNVSPSHIALITDIGLDHTKHLGKTRAAIAKEKQGIIKPGSKAFTISPFVTQATLVPADKANIIQRSLTGTVFSYKNHTYQLSVLGDFQVRNAVLAIEAARAMRVPYEAITKGLQSARNPARMQVVQQRPLIIVDGAHNPQKMRAFTRALQAANVASQIKDGNGKVIALIALKEDKDAEATLKPLVKLVDAVVITRFDGASTPVSVLQNVVKRIAKQHGKAVRVHTVADPVSAHAHWQEQLQPHDIGLITGSLYLIGELVAKRSIAV